MHCNKRCAPVAMIYSITSSARASSIGGMSRPSAFAVTKLNSQGCVRNYDIDLELNEVPLQPHRPKRSATAARITSRHR